MSWIVNSASDLAETLPLLAIETHELHLLDRHMVIRRGIDLNFGKSILQASWLLILYKCKI